jgi:tetratricopeptide (TPR) repeat protein
MSRLWTWVNNQSRPVRLVLAVGTLTVGGYVAHSIWAIVWMERQIQRATTAENLHDFPTARRLLNDCLAYDPTSGRVLFQAARVARREGDHTTARQLLDFAKQQDWPADAIQWEQQLSTAQTGHFPSVEPRLRVAVEAAPDDPVADLIREVLVPGYIAQYQILEAYTLLHDWCQRSPEALQPRLWMYDVTNRMLLPQRALEVARQAVAIAPNSAEARLKCGEILIENHQPAESRVHFDWLIERNPYHPQARFGLGKCLRELGEEAQAASVLDSLLRDFPERASYLAERGIIEVHAGRPQTARDYLQRAIAADPSDPILLYNYALCLEQLGATDEAKIWRERHSRAEADLAELKTVTEKIAKDQKNPELRYRAGELMLRNGLEREGVRWIRSAMNLDPKHAASQKALADYFDRVRTSVGAN